MMKKLIKIICKYDNLLSAYTGLEGTVVRCDKEVIGEGEINRGHEGGLTEKLEMGKFNLL